MGPCPACRGGGIGRRIFVEIPVETETEQRGNDHSGIRRANARPPTDRFAPAPLAFSAGAAVASRPLVGRGLHSSTFRLNVSTLVGQGLHPGVIKGVFTGCHDILEGV
jgi:hypothetical protein